jgi:hypothetical protein
MEGFYYAHWLLLALGCSAVIDLLVEKKTIFYLILSIVAIMSLAVFDQMQGVYLGFHRALCGICFGFVLYGKGGNQWLRNLSFLSTEKT